MNTFEDCLKGAWAALLSGDTSERDRLCARAEKLMQAEAKAFAIERVLATDFFVTRQGIVISSRTMAKAVGVIQ